MTKLNDTPPLTPTTFAAPVPASRSAALAFLTRPKDAYTRAEIEAITGEKVTASTVRYARLEEVPGIRPTRYTTASVRAAIDRFDIGNRWEILYPALTSSEADVVTISTKQIRDLVARLFTIHEQSHCPHEWADPIGEHPPACRFCRKPSAPSPFIRAHEHRTFAIETAPFGERQLCIACFEADAPHPGVPAPFTSEDATQIARDAMNGAWATICGVIARGSRH